MRPLSLFAGIHQAIRVVREYERSLASGTPPDKAVDTVRERYCSQTSEQTPSGLQSRANVVEALTEKATAAKTVRTRRQTRQRSA